MHEKSLVRSLLKQVEHIRKQNKAVSVDRITVEIGPLSGAEAELVQSAFDELAPQQFADRPVLDIQNVKLQIRCRECLQESAISGITFHCPDCQSSRVQVVRGDEFRLIDVSMQVPAAAGESDL